MRVVLVGGGTAGHTSPLIATAEAIRRVCPSVVITCIGTASGMEATVLPAAGFDMRFVESVPLPRHLKVALLKVPRRLHVAVKQAAHILAQTRADVVVGFGGYVAAPVYLAARKAHIPIVVQEQNTLPGLANRLAARFATGVSTAFPGTVLPGAKFTGLPVRRAVTDLAARGRLTQQAQARQQFGLPVDGPVLLVSGGSLGAQRLNTATVAARDELLAAGVSVLHVWGKKNFPADAQRIDGAFGACYLPLSFVDDMTRAYAAADLMLARAGAATVAETGTVGLPCIFVPLPHGNGEQRRNAASLIDAGAGVEVADADLTAAKLMAMVLPMLRDTDKLVAMGAAAQTVMPPGAADRVAAMVLAAGGVPAAHLVEPIELVDLSQVQRAHFMAIGGAGMSPIAHLWHQRGIDVDGCDNAMSSVVTALRNDDVPVTIGHDPSHLDGVDTVVVSSAIRLDNPERVAAEAAGLRVWHRSAALAALMADHIDVAVSGTHGKSTTSAMIACELAAIDPSYVLGATLVQTNGAHHAGALGGVFVIEADESDGSYRQYTPQVVVLTNIESDHLDRWGTPANYAAGFAQFASGASVQRVVLSADDPGTVALAAQLDASRVISFGEADGATVRLSDMQTEGLSSSAVVTWPGGQAKLNIELPGLHNLRNAAAAFAAALALRDIGVSVSLDDVIAGLAAYQGIERRFQVIGRSSGITVVDDYAHHPTEVRAAVATARHVVGPNGRLVVCFQPHLYTRTRDFADDFGQALAGADIAVVADVYAAREDPLPGVTGELVAKAARVHGADVIYAPTLDECVDTLVGLITSDGKRLQDGDLVMTVGAGDVTTVGPALLARLKGDADD